MKNTLSLKQGLTIQASQLAEWKTVLDSAAFELLRDKVGIENAKLNPDSSGFEVWRGTSMSNFIANLSIRLATGQTHSQAFVNLSRFL